MQKDRAHHILSASWVFVIRYKRNDGVDLTATLYLPPAYDKDRDGPLPCILWAYPREFKSKVQLHPPIAFRVKRQP